MSPSEGLLSHTDPSAVAAYLRVASIAVAAYDYLETLPTAWRFYKQQWAARRLTASLVLFFLLRITSISVLIFSNFTFFYDGFTPSLCSYFVVIVPTFKVLQAMVTQMILGLRTFNLSRRSRGVAFFLITAYFLVVTFQWISTLHHRKTLLHEGHGNCRAGGIHRIGAWIYYLGAITYDSTTTVISVIFLLKYRFSSSSSAVMSQITKLMLYDGLGYFVVLTAVNAVNLTLFRSHDSIQTAGASLGYCVSWIMSQRLLMHLSDATRERNEDLEREVTITRRLESHRDVSRAVRTQFEQKNSVPTELTIPDIDTVSDGSEENAVHVRIERTVKVKHRTYELEDYTR